MRRIRAACLAGADAAVAAMKPQAMLMQTLQLLTDAELLQPYRHYLPAEPDDDRSTIQIVYANTTGHWAEHLDWIETLLVKDHDRKKWATPQRGRAGAVRASVRLPMARRKILPPPPTAGLKCPFPCGIMQLHWRRAARGTTAQEGQMSAPPIDKATTS